MPVDFLSIPELRPGFHDFCRGCDSDERGEFEEAARFFRLAAAKGDTGSMTNLGNLLLDGKVKEIRPSEGMYWYKRAVAAGSNTGAWNLCMEYRMQRNKRWFIYWLKRAAEMGDSDAKAQLKSKSIEHLKATMDRGKGRKR